MIFPDPTQDRISNTVYRYFFTFAFPRWIFFMWTPTARMLRTTSSRIWCDDLLTCMARNPVSFWSQVSTFTCSNQMSKPTHSNYSHFLDDLSGTGTETVPYVAKYHSLIFFLVSFSSSWVIYLSLKKLNFVSFPVVRVRISWIRNQLGLPDPAQAP